MPLALAPLAHSSVYAILASLGMEELAVTLMNVLMGQTHVHLTQPVTTQLVLITVSAKMVILEMVGFALTSMNAILDQIHVHLMQPVPT